jgi:SNF2 family DNA or RNA helicase
MGLGKTIQIVCFLGGLLHCGLHRTSLIIAPVTTLKHWQRELRTWYPQFRVIVLHSSVKNPSGTSRHLAAPDFYCCLPHYPWVGPRLKQTVNKLFYAA